MENNKNEDNQITFDPNSLTKGKSANFTKISSKKNKGKDISQDIILNFKYDDFEPIINKYQPCYKKQHGKIYYDDVDILDQNRYKFILNIEDLGGGGNTKTISMDHYSKYSNKNNSNIKWEDIYSIIYYSVDIYTCPICLDKNLICPQITRCGHIFCWPCLISYYDFWTISAVAKKIPKCPLCQEQLNLKNTKFCDILNCVNYLSCLDEGSDTGYHALEKETPNKEKIHFSATSSYQTHFITFNLVMKDKKAPVLYNTFHDPYLEYYKKHMDMENMFNFVPLETDEAFSFSRIFSTTTDMALKKYLRIKHELEEAMKEELESISDERKIKSLDKCLDQIGEEIKYLSNLMQNQSLNEEEKESEKYDEEVTVTSSSKNIMIAEKSISNNENQSTIDDDLHKNEKIDYTNFIYFYQEQFGDIYYLHPIDYSILITEFGSEEHLPTEITGKILEIEMYQITPYIKNKYRFLNHLRIGSMFFMIEIDVKPLVSNHTLKQYHHILKERSKIRNSIKREEEHYNNYILNLRAKEERNFSLDNAKKVFTEIFEDFEYGLGNEADVIQTTIEINLQNDKKENKLRNLFDKQEDESENFSSENKKLTEMSKLLFRVNDFPDLDEASCIIEHESNLENCDYPHEEGNVSLIPKNQTENKKNNKKKKFVSLNVDIMNTGTDKSTDIPQKFSNKKGNTKSISKSSSMKKK